MAGLPSSGACVSVGPPLSCRGPSRGFTSSKSVASKPLPPVELPIRLWPNEPRLPEKSRAGHISLHAITAPVANIHPPTDAGTAGPASLPVDAAAAAAAGTLGVGHCGVSDGPVTSGSIDASTEARGPKAAVATVAEEAG